MEIAKVLNYAIYGYGFLFFMVIVHELGHYFMYKIQGFNVDEFSIGIGKEFFKVKIDNTNFVLRRNPFGGYVYRERKENDSISPKQFFLVASGGVLFNFIAFFLIQLFFILDPKLMGLNKGVVILYYITTLALISTNLFPYDFNDGVYMVMCIYECEIKNYMSLVTLTNITRFLVTFIFVNLFFNLDKNIFEILIMFVLRR